MTQINFTADDGHRTDVSAQPVGARTLKQGPDGRPLPDLYDTLLEQSGDGIFLCDVAGNFIEVNPAGCHMLGYSSAELARLNITGVIDSSEKKRIATELARLTVGKPAISTWKYRRKDGSLAVLQVNSMLINGKDGRQYLWAIVQDITERRLAEQSLRESEERFRIMVQQAPEAIVLFDIEQNCLVDANRNAELLFQCEREQLLQRSPLEFLRKDESDPVPIAQSFHEHNSRIINGEQLTFERMMRGAQGRESCCEIRLTALPAGDRKLVRASMIDITARKQIERERQSALEQLAISESKLKAIMENMSEGYTVIDFDMRYVYQNKTAVLHSHSEPGQLIGKNVMEVHPEGGENNELFCTLQRVLLSRTAEIVETSFTFQDGSTAWFELRIAPVAEGISVLSVDATQRKQNELELDQKRSFVTYLSRLAILGELSGAIAHELNQPLMSILMNAESAKVLLGRPDHSLDEVNEILTEIVQEDVRASGIIQRLRTLFAQQEVVNLQVDVNELITDVGKILKNELINRGIKLQLHLDAGLPLVNIDRIQIEQVLINLIINACDAMEGNGTDRERSVICTTAADGSGVKVSVADSGAGIQPEVLGKIFDPFFTTKKQGMGLGLSICRTIIQAHSGVLWAENNGNAGSCFHFTLPHRGQA